MLATPMVSGILRKLGEDLRVAPSTVFRALVERAHEACMARVLAEADFVPAILVTTETIGGRAQVSFCDNGAALAADQVRQVYRDPTRVTDRFARAMLAAFAISDQIIITTRSASEPGTRYICDTRTYRSEPYVVGRPGTTLQLRVRRERAELGDLAGVRAALMPHARSFELPIRVGADPQPL